MTERLLLRRFMRGWAVAAATYCVIGACGFRLAALSLGAAEARLWALRVGVVLSLALLAPLAQRRHVLAGGNLDHIWGVANVLTLSRGALFALLSGYLLVPRPLGPAAWAPAVLFAAGIAMDFLDGWWARRTASETRLGALLDMELDAVGILVAAALAVQYRRLPPVFLAVGAARYVFVALAAVRRRSGRPVHDLPRSAMRRRLAGFQMGVLAAALLPMAAPPTTTVAAALIAVPLLAGFVRDWLISSGSVDRRDPRYLRARALLARAAYRRAPPVLRAAAAAGAAAGLAGLLAAGSPAASRLALALLGCVAAGLAAAGVQPAPSALLLLLAETLSGFLAGPQAQAAGLATLGAALLLLLLEPGRRRAAACRGAGVSARPPGG